MEQKTNQLFYNYYIHRSIIFPVNLTNRMAYQSKRLYDIKKHCHAKNIANISVCITFPFTYFSMFMSRKAEQCGSGHTNDKKYKNKSYCICC